MWTIDELVERVGAALTAEYPGAPNGRVRDVPDRRAVRWYATTGLVDRPSAMRGRTALYEARHLLQLVAVKRLQADGRTLAEIQAELAGATDDRLAAVARVPSELLTWVEEPSDEAARPRFWATPPTSGSSSDPAWDVGRAQPGLAVAGSSPAASTGFEAPPATSAGAEAPLAASTGAEAPPPAASAGAEFLAAALADAEAPPAVLTGVVLPGGVVLLVPGTPSPADRSAIAAAARPLLDLLFTRGLTDERDSS
jgi:hypothetical protein